MKYYSEGGLKKHHIVIDEKTLCGKEIRIDKFGAKYVDDIDFEHQLCKKCEKIYKQR